MEEKEMKNGVPHKRAGRAALTAAAILAIALAAILTLELLSRLLIPKYMSGALDGAFIAEYYDETLPHDVLFVGDCEVFSNISPVAMWREYGITSYVRGSAQQLVWQSYWLLSEMLAHETPKAVVFNVLSLKYNEPQKEAYNRITLDGMKLSKYKLAAIDASMMRGERDADTGEIVEESMLDYIFPIFRYHSRWSSLSFEDVKYMFYRDRVTHSGYYMRVDANGISPDELPAVRPLDDYTFGSTAMEYLDKMVELCESHGVELILMKAPSLVPHWYDQYEAQIDAYAEAHGLRYINVLEAADEIGIDYETDTFDRGMHMNLSGAEKVTHYIGGILAEEFGIPDRRGEADYASVWSEKEKFYDEMIAAQEKELSELGHLVHFGAVG